MTHHLSYPADANGNEIEIEYCVTSFPILAHKFVNQDLLIDRLLHGTKAQEDLARSAYRGMIVTSQRAVEAYISAGVKAQDILRSQSKTSSSSPTQWTRVPFFAVGPATSSALRTVPLAPWLRPRLVMGGEATGTGETLARYVIRHFSSPSILDQNSDLLSAEQAPPLLYLVGDKNASTIPDMLSSAHVPSVGTPLGVSTMTSTETAANKRLDSLAIPAAAGGSPQLMASPATIEPGVINPIEEESVLKMLRSKVNNVSGGSGSNSGALQRIARPDWVVFFSPSGVNYALEEFRRRRWMPPDFRQQQQKEQAQADGLQNSVNTTVTSHAITTGKGSTGSPRKYPRIAVLGSTTRAWMVENLGIEPDAVALKPGPKELKDAIEAVELRLRAKA
uniref:Tetrapyrrole biosynthesis uroporphyrinogen III synthase domain-containing protein n=1 Tax=Kalmanozyma brasiliensis (strain GHG001) TaxID=1365824 RepID=V5EF40_KALBG